jgi:Fe-S cluster assembly protein SufD|tara:strand:+ start:1397 stop:2500 length:1104 start_codon:yes stop_codon:yes gene_type:complete
MGVSEELYLSLDEPPTSDHLWRYTPWGKIHPTGDFRDIPEDVGLPKINLSYVDGGAVEGVTLEANKEVKVPFEGSPTTDSFLMAITKDNSLVLSIPRKWTSEKPLLIDIETEGGVEALHIHILAGDLSEATILTRISGPCEWLGLLRTAETGTGSIVTDIVVNKTQGGSLIRVDAVRAGRDSTITSGTVSAGSERTKADIRYLLDSPGSSLNVLGSLLSAEKMHLDHHIEISHTAPHTYSRLEWHTACGGGSTSVGTGMLRIEKGAKKADAGQLFHNLLLSKKARANSIPELEVEENDVVGCGHGTANGPVDESQRFYLMARGFSKQESEDALIAAFLNSTLTEMGGEGVHSWLISAVEDALVNLNG